MESGTHLPCRGFRYFLIGFVRGCSSGDTQSRVVSFKNKPDRKQLEGDEANSNEEDASKQRVGIQGRGEISRGHRNEMEGGILIQDCSRRVPAGNERNRPAGLNAISQQGQPTRTHSLGRLEDNAPAYNLHQSNRPPSHRLIR